MQDEISARFWFGHVFSCGSESFLGCAACPGRPGRRPKMCGVPYDWRRPTVARVKSRMWNHDDPRLFTPKSFGWGWDVNLARLFRRR